MASQNKGSYRYHEEYGGEFPKQVFAVEYKSNDMKEKLRVN